LSAKTKESKEKYYALADAKWKELVARNPPVKLEQLLRLNWTSVYVYSDGFQVYHFLKKNKMRILNVNAKGDVDHPDIIKFNVYQRPVSQWNDYANF